MTDRDQKNEIRKWRQDTAASKAYYESCRIADIAIEWRMATPCPLCEGSVEIWSDAGANNLHCVGCDAVWNIKGTGGTRGWHDFTDYPITEETA